MSEQHSTDRTPSENVDVCIVGSGPAGALVADSLAERDHDVVVLEAGKRYTPEDRLRRLEMYTRPDMERGAFWIDEDRDAYTSTGEVTAALNQLRVKAVGGTLLWEGNTPRFHEKDFEMQSRYGLASDWPISYDDLRPYYARAEREMGISGDGVANPFGPPREEPFPMDAFPPSYSDSLFIEACDSLGITTHPNPVAINSEPHDGMAECNGFGACHTCPLDAKYTAEIHVDRAESKGARIIDQASVLSLEHDDSGDVLEAARYVTPDGSEHRQEADAFVVACGGIETPRLLLLSASEQHPDGLANSSGAVGRYLMDHPGVRTNAVIDRSTNQDNIGFMTTRSDQFYDHEDPTPGSFYLTFENREGGIGDPMQRDAALVQAIGALGNPTGPGGVRDVARDPFSALPLGDGMVDEGGRDGDVIAIRGAGELLPHADNRVTLDRSRTDTYGRPVPKIDLSNDEHARATMERCLEVQEDIMDELGAEITDQSGIDGRTMGTHHMGTTRMGTDPAESVVNAQCRTHDLDNCWIASASVFTTGGAMNPTLTIAALALKTADHVHNRL